MSMKVMEEMVTVLMFEGVQLSEDTYYVKSKLFIFRIDPYDMHT